MIKYMACISCISDILDAAHAVKNIALSTNNTVSGLLQHVNVLYVVYLYVIVCHGVCML